ncbi:MAG: DUF2283 domain-containing protein [Nanoarchaeota archaeon]
MKGQMSIYYDEEADYLEIFIGDPRPNYGEDVSNGVTLFKDEKTDEIVGIGILNFKKKTSSLNNLEIDLPIDINFVSKVI